MTKTYFAFLDDLTRIAELKIEQLFNVMGVSIYKRGKPRGIKPSLKIDKIIFLTNLLIKKIQFKYILTYII